MSLVANQQEISAGKLYNVGDEDCLTTAQTITVLASALDTEMELVSLPAALATPARPFQMAEHTLHQMMGVDLIRHELGYRDLVPAVEGLAATARHLRDNPIPADSLMQLRLQDPFDYAVEDQLMDAYRGVEENLRSIAGSYDPEFRDRYAPGSDDWRLVTPKN